jgi:hypothetical protein
MLLWRVAADRYVYRVHYRAMLRNEQGAGRDRGLFRDRGLDLDLDRERELERHGNAHDAPDAEGHAVCFLVALSYHGRNGLPRAGVELLRSGGLSGHGATSGGHTAINVAVPSRPINSALMASPASRPHGKRPNLQVAATRDALLPRLNRPQPPCVASRRRAPQTGQSAGTWATTCRARVRKPYGARLPRPLIVMLDRSHVCSALLCSAQEQSHAVHGHGHGHTCQAACVF